VRKKPWPIIQKDDPLFWVINWQGVKGLKEDAKTELLDLFWELSCMKEDYYEICSNG
jgi:hypothetical protein